ncbi:unnamed protein product [Notodromas monacha]|uniref:Uncharacterized protein n=1 Tax=Notodromas monacha TaxID=399045 RepID=A0A7R9BZ44_9CRUS|nr:unnamed protein product [Notodromas monacha]CAG0923206.1 unnamed protein product [Notodromas monacha]
MKEWNQGRAIDGDAFQSVPYFDEAPFPEKEQSNCHATVPVVYRTTTGAATLRNRAEATRTEPPPPPPSPPRGHCVCRRRRNARSKRRQGYREDSQMQEISTSYVKIYGQPRKHLPASHGTTRIATSPAAQTASAEYEHAGQSGATELKPVKETLSAAHLSPQPAHLCGKKQLSASADDR